MILRSLLPKMRAAPKRPFTVAVEGNIGCGKTTFLNHVSALGHVSVLAEPVNAWRDCNGHNLLQLMYTDPKKFAFSFQSYVQLTMLKMHTERTPKAFKLMERSIYSARYCFVENLHRDGLLSGPELSVLDAWFRWATQSADLGVDLIVYLRTDPGIVYERMLQRARAEESAVPVTYLQKLHDLHEAWLTSKTLGECPAKVLTIDANQSLQRVLDEYKEFEHQVLNAGSVALQV